MTSASLPSNSQPFSLGVPSFLGCIAGLALGAGLILFGFYLFTTSTPVAMNIGLVIVGLCEGVASYYALRNLRVAWAFTLSINSTLALVLLLSSPRIRDSAEISIGLALIPSLLFLTVLVLQSLKTPSVH